MKFLKEDEQIIIKDINELKPILRNLKFNCIYLMDFNYKEVQEYLLKSENHLTLF